MVKAILETVDDMLRSGIMDAATHSEITARHLGTGTNRSIRMDLASSFLSEITNEIRPGMVIPKPEATGDFVVKGWGKRRGSRALIYTIPNNKEPQKPYEKGITELEWSQAFRRLADEGEFTRAWFNQSMPACAKEGGCNFTTIGGILSALTYAYYDRRGVYRLRGDVPKRAG